MINRINAYTNSNLLKTYIGRTNPVFSGNRTPDLQDNNSDGSVNASILYINDVHGQNIRMERLVNAVKQFDSFTPNVTDKMKFASGDIMLGEDEKHIRAASKFLNLGGFMATVMGNHECDMPTSQFVDCIQDKKYKFLGFNLNPAVNNPLKNYIEKSYVQEINGHKYGIIGLVPPDLSSHVKLQEHLPSLNIETDFDKSIIELQKEVDKFKEQGINKIIVLSHSGYKNDVKLAQKVNGIDIILGAHTHNLLEGVEENKNLFNSAGGEPVIITQAGRDGNNFGILNVQFDDKGVIKKVQNNIGKTDEFNRNLVAKYEFENILGKPEVVGSITYAEKFPADMYIQENAHCDFILDAMRSELGTDLALMNAANIRGQFDEGRIDTRDLAVISPFANKVVVVNISEEELVNSIKLRIASTIKSSSHRPGIVQVSGLKYSFNMNGELLSMSIIGKDSKETPIDINNPRKDKMYSVASDDYCVMSEESGLGLAHRLEEATKIFDYDKDVVVGQYIKHQTKPIEIKSDNRITIVP